MAHPKLASYSIYIVLYTAIGKKFNILISGCHTRVHVGDGQWSRGTAEDCGGLQ